MRGETLPPPVARGTGPSLETQQSVLELKKMEVERKLAEAQAKLEKVPEDDEATQSAFADQIIDLRQQIDTLEAKISAFETGEIDVDLS
ncbi:hypothetical protein A3B21_02015 [Candidatus Uhrbacteria bacterium RIFCSPLOWO2_01_FULL_47_24]|uniref:Uncharacterized protein n=1 Tax=Candidatus Uhrbacteria bacterium RIFCSPLOWO2_01_FULL_47_24 TaxID=1802401 RepID=A0A1F7UPA5_9BACT|nr:MAG: hypothetical protein A2753_01765 [Candidatus Uhrbacteria bacterium RIFCSPHIGHO2_01_FULL_47_11]OGL67944.1 MAG: hypothetical protein A3D58_05210 [Candidatus Uhrbacteria bacterium RIFCSPHIGHO2_02_FULL_46_47]OGL76433.1 MAG: hypothetical protein A3F52_02850 [Candidatus Uhrbacteria bacterium RIFCSPHIGHO2_12_FULL_47_11]OGL80130.1 MAG: hypothetical protein A3B21_02015 [Candidatus Uhrbacteria bacterium RIFCSPLOWO2_01_FULL_47_24]OGL84915.1 MAG: hypothetical protein A3J03_04395 [Candidatus Uhrbact